MEEIRFYLDEAKDSMQKALKHTESEFTKIRAGKASPSMIDGVLVDYYGTLTPISQVAAVGTPDARTITIKPWEKKMIFEIEKAIRNSDLGLNPQTDSENVRLNIPPLTEERRKNLVKQAKAEAENGKVRIRAIRKETNEELKKLLKDGAAEDAIKKAEENVQTLTDEFIVKIDQALSKKESEIMTI
jgi:ribosome recycling factor